jgi:hypothetical protein
VLGMFGIRLYEEPRYDVIDRIDIPKNVVAFDQDVAEIDPDPKQHTPVLRDTFVPLGHHRLHSDRALDRIDH